MGVAAEARGAGVAASGVARLVAVCGVLAPVAPGVSDALAESPSSGGNGGEAIGAFTGGDGHVSGAVCARAGDAPGGEAAASAASAAAAAASSVSADPVGMSGQVCASVGASARVETPS